MWQCLYVKSLYEVKVFWWLPTKITFHSDKHIVLFLRGKNGKDKIFHVRGWDSSPRIWWRSQRMSERYFNLAAVGLRLSAYNNSSLKSLMSHSFCKYGKCSVRKPVAKEGPRTSMWLELLQKGKEATLKITNLYKQLNGKQAFAK